MSAKARREPGPGGPPVRIRHLLLVALLASGVAYVFPRAKATWVLHSTATTFADYAKCMAGPMGPALLRDDPTRFWRLVRRRLVASPADSRPFGRCAHAAYELTDVASVAQAHRARAWDFVEYGGDAADTAQAGGARPVSLADLRVTRQKLAELAKAARPFVRGGYARLVKASSHAYEAPHPVPLPKPAVGHGLPSWPARYRVVEPVSGGHLLAVGRGANLSAFKSTDGGVTWTPASVHTAGLGRVAGRCPVGDGAAFQFDLTANGTELGVRSLRSDGSSRLARLAKADVRVVAASCDDDALVALLARENAPGAELFQCAFGGPCSKLQAPGFIQERTEVVRGPADVARLDGVTVLAVTMHGIVRVSSSRDGGKTWTPWTVAHDAGAKNGVTTHVASPSRLLVLGSKLVLYGGASRPKMTYPVLVSHDHGASWRFPGEPPRVVARAH